ncbi:MAG: hypothetical protein HQL32_16655, partial [Planctomycetes bacterium]|nr:hypothetical protein [Planctomycetota bacterium]
VSVDNPVDKADAIVVRFSVPPSAEAPHYGSTGALDLYVNNQFRQAITLHSKYAYQYTKGGNKPSEGTPAKRHYNEFRFKLKGEALERGNTLTLRKGENSLLKEYNIDLIDFEVIPDPRNRPGNSVSVKDFGAVGDGVTDDTKSFLTARDTAREENKSLWIPAGTFLVSSQKSTKLIFENQTVRGAGVWHTTLLRRPPVGSERKHRTAIVLQGKSILSDVYIKNELFYEGDYVILANGEGWKIERIWSHNTGPCWLSGNDGVIRDSRMSDHWGDGININNSNRNTPHSLGNIRDISFLESILVRKYNRY